MPDQYQIVETQFPILGIGGHNLLAILDPNGNVIAELDGLATNPDGTPTDLGIGWIPFHHRLNVFDFQGSFLYNQADPNPESIPFLVEILERPRCSPHALRVPSTRSAFPLLACSAARNCGRGQ